MNKIIRSIEKRWKAESVKYKHIGRGLRWVKTLRSVDCVICGERKVEEKEDQGFLNWGLLIHELDGTGRAPEVCPDCMKEISGDAIPAPRFAECSKCKTRQREKIYGVGWPGWKQLIIPTRQSREIVRNLICPNCVLELARKLGEKYIRGSWTALTYAAGSLLTSTKMTQTQANFAALGETDASAPAPFDTISAAQWAYLNACGAGGGQLLAALTTGESDQLELIGATTISAAQWVYLGAMDYQPLADNIIKGWIQFNGVGEIAIQDSFNVSSIADGGVGIYTVNWDTDFANDDYSFVAASANYFTLLDTVAAGSVIVKTQNDAPDLEDTAIICVIALGDQ